MYPCFYAFECFVFALLLYAPVVDFHLALLCSYLMDILVLGKIKACVV